MENNENNIQNEVRNVENNVKLDQEKAVANEKKSGKWKTIVLMILVLLLVLAVGVLAGMMFSGNNKPEFVKQIEEKVTNKEESKENKKIDESKDWVYDAEYLNDKNEKVKTNKENNITVKSSEAIKLPFININSDDGKKANEEIKELAEKAYDDFGKALEVSDALNKQVTTRDDWFTYTSYSYEKNIHNNILSVTIKKMSVSVPGDGTRTLITYNFNLDTLKFATLEEVGKACGFSSEAEIKEKINVAMENARSEAEIFEDTVWDEKRFCINNGKLNIVLPGPALTEIVLDVDKDATYTKGNGEQLKLDSDSNTGSTNQNSKNNMSFMANEGFTNVTYQSEKKDNSYLYKIVFDGNGNPTISVEYHKTDGYENDMYGTYRDFYDVEDDVGAGQEYVSFKFKDLNGTGSEQNGVIHYSHVTDNENIDLKLSVPYGDAQNKEITLYKVYSYERPDDTNRTSGKLTITNFTNESFDFEINATHVNGENIEESIAHGGVNFGDVSGRAKKISGNEYQFIPDNMEEIKTYYDSEYKINFIIKDDNSIEVKEIYDDIKYGQGPYSGGNVRLSGIYVK